VAQTGDTLLGKKGKSNRRKKGAKAKKKTKEPRIIGAASSTGRGVTGTDPNLKLRLKQNRTTRNKGVSGKGKPVLKAPPNKPLDVLENTRDKIETKRYDLLARFLHDGAQ